MWNEITSLSPYVGLYRKLPIAVVWSNVGTVRHRAKLWRPAQANPITCALASSSALVTERCVDNWPIHAEPFYR